jgi:DNA-binding MarR family transcriptional regulator
MKRKCARADRPATEEQPDKLAVLECLMSGMDTLEGIVQWRLLEQSIKYETAKVKKALDELVAEGLILERRMPDSRICYQVNPGKMEEILTLLNQNRDNK